MDTTVVHSDKTGVDSKYNPNVGSKYDLSVAGSTYSGTAEVRIRSMSNLMNPTLVLVNNAMPDVNKTIDVAPTGVTDITELPVGTYTITLNRFDLPAEVATFKIAAAQQQPTYVTFMGQAFSAPAAHVKVINILRAQYGIITQSCHQETVTDTEVRTVCVPVGSNVDVTPSVQNVVASGVTSFVFRNDYTPGGIFNKDSTALLSPIADPAYGQVKNVVITYNVDGGVSQTVNTQEYQVINLN
jgi:hypothetical protein